MKNMPQICILILFCFLANGHRMRVPTRHTQYTQSMINNSHSCVYYLHGKYSINDQMIKIFNEVLIQTVIIIT